jgi:hypothetical protein
VSTKGGSILMQHATPKLPDPTTSMHTGNTKHTPIVLLHQNLADKGQQPDPRWPHGTRLPQGICGPGLGVRTSGVPTGW